MPKTQENKTPGKAMVVRKHIRFRPGLDCYASVDFVADRKVFTPSLVALVLEEAYSGCGLVALTTPKLQVGDVCRVQVGRLAPIRAEVRWRKQLDEDVIRLGLMYLE